MINVIKGQNIGNKAFTLVELLVVIAIIGILSAVGLSAFQTSQMRSRDAQRKSDLRQLSSALELFYSDYEVYPSSSTDGTGRIVACPYISGGNSSVCTWGTSEFRDTQTNGVVTKTIYFVKMPKDPRGGNYFYVSTGQEYKLYARLENTQDPDYPNNYIHSCGTGVCNFSITSTNTTP